MILPLFQLKQTIQKERAHPGSNWRPVDLQSTALPLSYTPAHAQILKFRLLSMDAEHHENQMIIKNTSLVFGPEVLQWCTVTPVQLFSDVLQRQIELKKPSHLRRVLGSSHGDRSVVWCCRSSSRPSNVSCNKA